MKNTTKLVLSIAALLVSIVVVDRQLLDTKYRVKDSFSRLRKSKNK